MDESLADKLRSLGVRIGAGGLPEPAKKMAGIPIDAVVTGDYIDTPFGDAFRTETMFTHGYHHGDVELNLRFSYAEIASWAKLSFYSSPHIKDLVFLDTETSGLAGGTGTFAFLIGLGYFSTDGFKVVQLFMREPAEETALLALLTREIHAFKAVVTFNGKSFDIPLLNDRHVLNRISTPFAGMGHIDLLPLARRIWRSRLPSRALKDLEQEIIHFARSQDEVPGWMIPEVYFEYLRTQDARPLSGVFYHNAIDIVSLAALFQICSDWISNPLNVNIPGLDLVSIGKIHEDLGKLESSLLIYQASLEKKDLPLPNFFDMVHRYALIYRKREDWQHATSLWHLAGSLGDFRSLIELAKYYEHQLREYDLALQSIDQAAKILFQDEQMEKREKENFQLELNRRMKRVQQKLQHAKP